MADNEEALVDFDEEEVRRAAIGSAFMDRVVVV